MTITLNAGQQDAAGKYLDFLIDPTKTEMVIEGPAGTGKSTLVRHLLFNMEKEKLMLNTVMGTHANKLNKTLITATTHKAAHVIAEVTGQEARTIHSLLGLEVRNDFKTGKTKLVPRKDREIVSNAIILIDEASFIDSNLLEWIRKSTKNCKILYIGDPYQLAPTLETTTPVFTSGLFTARLTEVVRNEGAIEKMSGQFRDSVTTLQFPMLEPDGSKVIHVNGPTFQAMIDHVFQQPEHNSKIIAWSNKKVHEYNDYVRALNGNTGRICPSETLITNKPIDMGEFRIRTDSKIRINYIVGDAIEYGVPGYYVNVSKKNVSKNIFIPDNRVQAETVKKQAAQQKDWRAYFTIKDEWGDFRPTHACTIHKSQGSTYDRVFINLSDIGRCNIPSDVARMLYVAISRASEQVILYGNLPAKYGGLLNAA